MAKRYSPQVVARSTVRSDAAESDGDRSVVRLLGAVDLARDGQVVAAPSTPLRRTLLALLALADGAVVDGERLLEQAWDGQPPSSGRRALRFHISKLRDEVGDGIVETVGAGYRLSAPTDIEQFRTEPNAESALALWRGEPFADATSCAELDHASGRLDERRLVRLEQYAAELLAAGRPTEAVDLLTPACQENPLRESMWGLLVQGHYNGGNQVVALRLLADLRTRLRDELGLDPSAEIEAIEGRILRHDDQRRAPVAGATSRSGVSPADAVPNVERRRRGNVVHPTTAFVGRREQLALFADALADARLLTITGPGGAGKTRLALELGREVEDRFANGVWVVDLSQLDASPNIEDEIIAIMGLRHSSGRTNREILCDALEAQSALLILDTCEHLVAAAADLVEYLIVRCPELAIVATSRVTLGTVSGVTRSIEGLGADAVELFEARAAATRFGFALTDQNRPYVEQICAGIDDLPLAIELVAARAGTFDLDTLLERLPDLFLVAPDSTTTRIERHKTLESAIAWSYGLMGEQEQTLFHRLTVFRGSCALGAIEDVCSDPALPQPEIADLVERLVEASMLVPVDDEWIGRRYRLLDTTRSFAAARLAETGHVDHRAERHARHYAAWVDGARTAAWGDDAGRVRRQAIAEMANFKAAAEWATAHSDLDVALSLATAGASLFGPAGRYDAGPWLAPALELEGAESHPLFIAALLGVRSQIWGAGDMDGAEMLSLRGLRLDERNADLHGTMMPILRSKAQRTDPPDPALLARAHAHARRSFELAQGDPRQYFLNCTPYLAQLFDRGLHDELVATWKEMAAVAAAHPSAALRAFAANAAGPLSLVDPGLARPILEEALPVSVELNLTWMTSRLLAYLASIEARSGETTAAVRRLFEAIDDDVSRGSWFSAYGWMHRLVPVLVAGGYASDAVQLHHAIPMDQAMIWVGDDPVDALATARESLGTDRYDELAELGRTMGRAELLTWLRLTVERVLGETTVRAVDQA